MSKLIELCKGAVRSTARAIVITKRVATPPAKASIAFISTLAISARDEYNKAKVAKELEEPEQPEQLELPLEDPNETAKNA